MNPLRITGAVANVGDGVLLVSKHTTSPTEFFGWWEKLGRPDLTERSEDGIPFVRCSIEGVGWRLSVNLMARTLADMHVELEAA